MSHLYEYFSLNKIWGDMNIGLPTKDSLDKDVFNVAIPKSIILAHLFGT